MKRKDRVKWKSPISGLLVHGVLNERTKVVAVSEADHEVNPKGYQDTNFWSWEVVGNDGKIYTVPEDNLSPELIVN